MSNKVQHLNPYGLHKNPAFTQVVTVESPAKTVYVGGQNAVDGATGTVVGKGDLRAQAEQIFKNLKIALAAAGAGLEHVVKWNINAVQGQPLHVGFEAFQKAWGDRRSPPPAITVAIVAGLANPDFLMELDAVAVIPS